MVPEAVNAEPRRRPGPDIQVLSFEFAVEIVALCQVLDERGGVARTLSKQLLRSGTSIGANVEEAQAGQSRADFLSKILIALKEARESRYWLRLLLATKLAPESAVTPVLSKANSITKILGAIASTTRRSLSSSK